MNALLVVDMIHDFVDGKFGSEQVQALVPRIKKLLEKFRERGALIIYVNDAHRDTDPEIKIWGAHAMQNEYGSKVVEDIAPSEGDIVIEKHTYDGFLFTDLESVLISHGVKKVYIVGVATDICVMHTAYGAFARGFDVYVVEDCCAGTTNDAHAHAIEYMKKVYGAHIVRSDEI